MKATMKATDLEKLLNRVVINPNILGSKPVIRGTRIPIYLIIELLAAGMSIKDVLKQYTS